MKFSRVLFHSGNTSINDYIKNQIILKDRDNEDILISAGDTNCDSTLVVVLKTLVIFKEDIRIKAVIGKLANKNFDIIIKDINSEDEIIEQIINLIGKIKCKKIVG